MKRFPAIYTSDGVYYIPFYNDGRVGYIVRTDDGSKETTIYFNPSDDTDDGVPNVFVYIGVENDPALDAAIHHYDLADELGLNR